MRTRNQLHSRSQVGAHRSAAFVALRPPDLMFTKQVVGVLLMALW